MPHRQFDALKEQLLRGGIAPKHVRRYVRELEDHLDDLVREEIRNGATKSAAETAAQQRLGDNDTLSRAIFDQPELKSLVARYPWIVFGVVPPLALLAMVTLSIVIETGAIAWIGTTSGGSSAMPNWGREAISVWHSMLMYVAPFGIAATIGYLGIQQRMPFAWLLLGSCIVLALGSFLNIGIVWSDIPEQSSLSVGFGMSTREIATLQGISRPAAIVIAIGALFWTWRKYVGFERDDVSSQ